MKLREIKFRIWDKKYSMFDYNSSPELFISTEGEVYELDRDEYSKADYYEVSQYTGLKDKNGKEIYEGDIIQNDRGTTILRISFTNGAFYAEGSDALSKRYVFDNLSFFSNWSKVIGNIYENPELLEVLQ